MFACDYLCCVISASWLYMVVVQTGSCHRGRGQPETASERTVSTAALSLSLMHVHCVCVAGALVILDPQPVKKKMSGSRQRLSGHRQKL